MRHHHRPTLSSELRNKKEEQAKLIQQLVTYVLVCVLLECFVVYSVVVIRVITCTRRIL